MTTKGEGSLREPTHALEMRVVVAMCANAIQRWYEPMDAHRGGTALADVMSAMARFTRLRGGKSVADDPVHFLAELNRPLSDLLPGGPPNVLVEDSAPSEFCLDVIAESGEDPAAEAVQAQVGAARDKFGAMKEGGPARYAAFRRFLIENATTTEERAFQGLLGSGLPPSCLYERVPQSCVLQCGAEAVVFPCPRCRWPMQRTGVEVRCLSEVCRAAGARFRLTTDGRLASVGALGAPDHVPHATAWRLRHGAWRYTTQPGLAEIDLADRAAQLDGVSVTLWPNLDEYDVLVVRGALRWEIDVKDWADAGALARHLVRHPPTRPLHVVVPDRQRDHLAILRARCASGAWTFHTVSSILKRIRRSEGAA